MRQKRILTFLLITALTVTTANAQQTKRNDKATTTYAPVNPNATPLAKALLARLYQSVADGKIISGLHHNQLMLPAYMRDFDRIEEAFSL